MHIGILGAAAAHGYTMTNDGEHKLQGEVSLQKKLSPLNVWAIAFGCIIGWGSFVNPGKKFLHNSGVAGTAIAMACGALIMIVIAFSYAYMVPKYPRAGGEFYFTKACFGNHCAFFCGWFLVAAYLTNVPMNSTAIGLIVDGLFGPILKFGFHYSVVGYDVYAGEVLLAAAILVSFGFLNIRGVKVAGCAQTVLAVGLVTSVLTLTFAALTSPYTRVQNLAPLWGFDKAAAIRDFEQGVYSSAEIYAHSGANAIVASILSTLAIAPWAFVGFDTIPQAVEEFRFSYRKVSGIMIVAIVFGCFVYVTNNTIAAAALSNWPDLIVHSDETPWLLLTAAQRLLGTPGKVLVGTAVSCAVLSGIMGFYIASSRLMYAMAQDGFLPKAFAQIDARYGTPKKAIQFCMAISLAGPILGREALGWFLDMSAIGASVGFGFTCLSALKTMDRYSEGTSFLTWMSRLGSVFSGIFIVLQIVPIPGLESVRFCRESYLLLLVWIAMGAGFYFFRLRGERMR